MFKKILNVFAKRKEQDETIRVTVIGQWDQTTSLATVAINKEASLKEFIHRGHILPNNVVWAEVRVRRTTHEDLSVDPETLDYQLKDGDVIRLYDRKSAEEFNKSMQEIADRITKNVKERI